MPNSAPRIAEGISAGDAPSAECPARAPVPVSAQLPPEALSPSEAVRRRLLYAAALPLVMGGALYGVEGAGAVALLRRAWPAVGLLAAAYVAAVALHVRVARFPFVGRVEAALVSVGPTLLPAGGLLGGVAAPPVDTLGLVATGASVGWFFVTHLRPSARPFRVLVVPSGATNRLFALPGISPETAPGHNGRGDRRAVSLGGMVTDPHEAADEQGGRSATALEGHPVYSAGAMYRVLTGRVPLDEAPKVEPEPWGDRAYSSIKRVLDVLVVLGTLPLTVPVIAATALAIRLESAGPVLFWQERVGQGGETFQMAKFRSMRVDNGGADDAVITEEDDDRVTRVGRLLRTLRLDELPQFWNVLRGDMSLIGPRPEQVGLAESFAETLDRYAERHHVRPGITGWAQVRQGYAVGEEETHRKLEHDLFYVTHRSLALDLLIVALTIRTILTGFGAR